MGLAAHDRSPEISDEGRVREVEPHLGGDAQLARTTGWTVHTFEATNFGSGRMTELVKTVHENEVVMRTLLI